MPNIKNIHRAIVPAIFIAFFLAACGGGGGGGGSSSSSGGGGDGSAPFSNQPQPTSDPALPGYDFSRGIPSNSNAALAALKSDYTTHFGDSLSIFDRAALASLNTQQFNQLLNEGVLAATLDTNAREAWRQGWTRVCHLDDFETRDIPFFDTAPTLKSHGDLTRIVTVQVAPEITHLAQQLTLTCDVTADAQDRQIIDAYAFMESNGYHIVNNSFGSDRYDDGSCSGSAQLTPANAWNDLVNLAAQDATLLRVARSDTSGYDANMLFIYAAGNNAHGCPFGRAECNLYAAAVKKMRDDGDADAGDRVIFVGAVNDDGISLAGYSHRAGTMQQDYIVAHDDVVSVGIGQGTSFAAPRVAGAAALVRHKFPNLDGPQLKQVILQTADDLGAPDVDSVYGHGRLNVLNALSPIGRVTAQ